MCLPHGDVFLSLSYLPAQDLPMAFQTPLMTIMPISCPLSPFNFTLAIQLNSSLMHTAHNLFKLLQILENLSFHSSPSNQSPSLTSSDFQSSKIHHVHINSQCYHLKQVTPIFNYGYRGLQSLFLEHSHIIPLKLSHSCPSSQLH